MKDSEKLIPSPPPPLSNSKQMYQRKPSRIETQKITTDGILINNPPPKSVRSVLLWDLTQQDDERCLVTRSAENQNNHNS